jgi:class 3 adenylate cyclase/tetratricopeptide (TPR) repeat protein
MNPRHLAAHVPQALRSWPDDRPAHRRVEGTLAFLDISGFTRLSEKLAGRGKVGAEEIAEAIDGCFSELLSVAYGNGGDLLKFGGDALLLLFTDEEHVLRAAGAVGAMRSRLREVGLVETPGGRVRLRMSAGMHSGEIDLFLAGGVHRELVVAGPAATRTVEMEAVAGVGQIVVSPELAETLPASRRGDRIGEGVLLRTSARPCPLGDLDPTWSEAWRPFLLPFVAGAGRELEPEHRLATVAFVRFEGVDSRLARVGTEATSAAVDGTLRRIQEVAGANGVTFLGTDIDRNGGKVILTAGVPNLREDDEGRMLRTLTELVDGSAPLPLSAGVNRGHVFAGGIGPVFRRTYTVMGDTVNLAARLLGRAGAGEVVAARSLVERCRASFEATPLEPFRVKGKQDLIHAAIVGRPHLAEDGPVGDVALVGREAELRMLVGSLPARRDGTGAVVEIVGEAGLGKSRLVREARAAAGELTVHAVACQPYEAATPYFATRVLLRSILGIAHDEREESVTDRLIELVAASAPQLRPWMPLLGIAVGAPIPPTPETRHLEERFRRVRLEEATGELLAAVLDGPALVILEDTHWMDEASASLLRRVIGSPAAARWVVWATRRPSPGGLTLPEHRRLRTAALRPLARGAAAELIRATSGGAPLLPHVAAQLLTRGSGNPLFLRELVASADSGENALPETVESAVAAHIDRLPPVHRTTLRRLAVLGPSFDERLAAAVLDHPADAGTWRRLEEFVERTGETITFRHALIRDTAYEGLSFRLRRELHGRAAESIERLAYPDVDDHAEVLALHFLAAKRYGSAWIYARVAARRAQAIFANVEAASFYDTAIEAAHRLGDIPESVVRELYEALGDVTERLGEFPRADRAYRAARARSTGDPELTARLFLKQAWVARRAGRLPHALGWITRGRRVVEGRRGSAAAAERARLTAWYGSLRLEQGRSADAIRWCTQAVMEARTAGARDVLAHASYVLDWAQMQLGRLQHPESSQLALSIYEELDDLSGQANVLNNLGGFAHERGDWDQAVEFYERGRRVRQRTGDAVNAAFGTVNLGEVLSDQGRLEEAEPLIREALEVWRAAGYRSGIAYALDQLGRVAYRAGRFEEAIQLLDESLRIFEFIGADVDALAVSAHRAECALLSGDAAGALTLTMNALERADRVEGATYVAPLLHRVRGSALARLGERGEAIAVLEESLTASRTRALAYEAALTLIELGRIPGSKGGRTLEEEGRSILQGLGVTSLGVAS